MVTPNEEGRFLVWHWRTKVTYKNQFLSKTNDREGLKGKTGAA